MLKGKAEWSFLGIKLQVEPSSATLDDLLDDIDDVLERLHRKLIVVVDDLDRLDAKGVNNVLFTTRKTFRLRNAVYILCYDNEVLATSKEEGERARQFLEKFINVKLSLFVDTSSIISFLRHDWANDAAKYQSIPSVTMLKLGSVLSEVANTLESEDAAGYAALLGDLRKVKRLVNALLLIRIEEADLDKTDFHRGDLVNLVLLHLHFPGIFRDIYAEETDGRTGRFSIKRGGERGASHFENDARFLPYLNSLQPPAHFLLTKLFSVGALGLEGSSDAEEAVRTSRACFNEKPARVLEQYLKLIVRFAAPEHRKTFKLYQDSVDKVIGGATVQEVLGGPSFDLRGGEYSHDQFWRVLVNRAHEFRGDTGEDAISTLVACLPRYSAVDNTARGLRHRSLFTLISLIDRAGWGRTPTGRRANTPENVVEIAHRFFGDGKYEGRALIEALAAPKRGLLGLYDLLVFRLQCSADRGGQIYNVTTGLVVYSDPSGPTSGPTVQIAIAGLRLLSQRVFALFKARYIDTRINYFDEAGAITDDAMLGEAAPFIREEARKTGKEPALAHNLAGMRTLTLNLISFQLANKEISLGVGAGYYDLEGTADQGGISVAMNDYLFDFCFNPDIQVKNYEHFLDFCLANLTRSSWSGDDEQDGYHASAQGLTRGIDAEKLREYWAQHAAAIKQANFTALPKEVATLGYVAKYSEDLSQVYDVLDEMVRSVEAPSTGAAHESSEDEGAK